MKENFEKIEKEVEEFLSGTKEVEQVKRGCFGLLYTDSKTCKACADKEECRNAMKEFDMTEIESEVEKIHQEIGVQADPEVEIEIEKYVPEIQEEVKKVEKTEVAKHKKPIKKSKVDNGLLEQYPELAKLFEQNKEFTPKRLEIVFEIINLKFATIKEVSTFVKDFLGKGKSEATVKTYVNVVLNMLKKAGYITVEKGNITWGE